MGLAGCSPDATHIVGIEDRRLVPGPRKPEHSAAAFEVDTTEAILFVWAPEAESAVPIVEHVATGQQVILSAIVIQRDAGDTGATLISGMSPGQDYRWHLRFDNGTTTDWFMFRTAPLPNEEAPLHLIYSSDIDVRPVFDSPIFATMAASGADVFVSLGDWPYADQAPAAWTVDEFRAKYREVRIAPKIQPLLRAFGIRAIYDDHDIHDDWAGLSISYPDRLAAGLKVWDEWFPLPKTGRRYRSWRWGTLAEMFMLDTRMYRREHTWKDNAQKTMIGAEQRKWLIDGVKASTAAFKLIFTSVVLDFGNTFDDWTIYTHERGLMFDGLRGVPGVVFLSGDQHWFGAHHHKSGFVEWTAGPLARTPRAPPPAVPGVVARAVGVFNYGDIVITPGLPPKLTFTARGPNGAVLYEESIVP